MATPVPPPHEHGLSDSDWDTLLQFVSDGSCTPFLGAGASAGILPVGPDIAKKWAEKFHFPFRDRIELPGVSQFVAVERDDNMWPKHALLRSFKETISCEEMKAKLSAAPESAVRVLARMPFTVYMTTNYDPLMSMALELEGKHPEFDFCRWNDRLRGSARKDRPRTASTPDGQHERKPAFAQSKYRPTVERPVVFHLHGHESAADSLVLTEDDYFEFLISLSRREILPAVIQQAFANSLLFVGYRLADLDFRVLFSSLFGGNQDVVRYSNIAVQLPPSDGPRAQSYLTKYFQRLKVKVYWGSGLEFAAELNQRWEKFER